MILIGVDPGVKTGFCLYDTAQKKITTLETLKIHQAFFLIHQLTTEQDIKVYFEDARQRNWFGTSGREKLQGAGSIKRDCKAWQDFLEDEGIEFEMIPPRNNMTKTKADFFKSITGWTERTSEHARDAAMLVFGK